MLNYTIPSTVIIVQPKPHTEVHLQKEGVSQLLTIRSPRNVGVETRNNMMSSRLDVLSRQMCGMQLSPTAGEEEQRPAPAGGRGTLTVVDNRTGKKYTVNCWCIQAQQGALAGSALRDGNCQLITWPLFTQLEISDGGTINAQALKQIKAGGDGVGLRTYDPGQVRGPLGCVGI